MQRKDVDPGAEGNRAPQLMGKHERVSGDYFENHTVSLFLFKLL